MLLKLGSEGDDVKRLQTKLGITVDGDFGPATEKRVKEWQTQNGLTPDGVVGDITWGKMNVVIKSSTSKFKLNALKGHIPDSVISKIDEVAIKFNITTPLRLAHFLSQCGHESGGFSVVNENLNYSAAGLQGVFSKYFPGDLENSYARNPKKIANRVYANRMGNGDEKSGDGWKFRGRGYIQLTGKNNYKRFSDFINEDCISNPDLVSTKYPLASAAFFFDSNNLWRVCDSGSDVKAITAVTKRVNGGTIGLSDRIKHFNEYYNLLK